jgi:MFS family permease
VAELTIDADKSVAPAEEKTLAEREADYEAFVWKNLPRNYFANFMHGMLGMTGMRILNAPTFLPAYLFSVSGSTTIVGLGLALQQVGQIVSPVVAAGLVENQRKVMRFAAWIGGIARLQILALALCGFFIHDKLILTSSLLLFITLFGLFMGAQQVVFQLLISKVIPLARRGRLQAWRNMTGGLIAAVISFLAGRYLIGHNVLGNGYATTFLLSAVLTTAGLTILQFVMREPETVTIREKSRISQRLREFPRLLTANRPYMFFVIVQALAAIARMAVPFYILYAGETIKMTGANIGILSIAYLGADTVANLVWGYLGDKKGFRIVTVGALTLWAAATVMLLQVHSLPLIFIAFCGLGGSQSGWQMSAQTMILEFGSRHELPMRMALSSTAQGFFAALAPLLGGVIGSHLGYPVLFWVSAGVLSAALLLMLARVPDPRATAAAATAARAE